MIIFSLVRKTSSSEVHNPSAQYEFEVSDSLDGMTRNVMRSEKFLIDERIDDKCLVNGLMIMLLYSAIITGDES